MKVGYLGPQGTFSEEAILSLKSFKEEELIPLATEQDVLRETDKGRVSKGIVPIENSIEGTVNVTLDTLTFETNLLIEREIVTPVKHNLLAPPHLGLTDIARIISHPQATAQCRKFLSKNFPSVAIEAANSTAEAARKAAKSQDAAAIGTALAAKLYNLRVLASKIQDYKDNQTRFVLVGREAVPPTGRDKTSVVCFIYEDRPGSLLEILQEFAKRDINLTKIQSRPTKESLGEYYFWIDMEGHIEDKQVGAALAVLQEKIRNIKMLGSYPRAR